MLSLAIEPPGGAVRQSTRRPFGGIERRGTAFRARYHGPDGDRYEGPYLFAARVDAEYWLAEVHGASGN
jgi:hypothetical protein